MACEPGPSNQVVIHSKRREDVSLASSESSGCSSDHDSPSRSPAHVIREKSVETKPSYVETVILSESTSTSTTDKQSPIRRVLQNATTSETSEKDSRSSSESLASHIHLSTTKATEAMGHSQFEQNSASSPKPGIRPSHATDIIHHHPVFVKDTSKYWYKPHISREQAINMLRDKHPGTFVVRDSNSFPGAFGLALKVATPPPGVAQGDGTELVRHFLIEPSPKGVKLKGCNNEPVFGSLSALVYQHSITPLALPTRLILPEYDPATTPEHVSATQALLEQGAACNVAYIGSIDVESLTGSECVRRAIVQAVEEAQGELTRPVSVHFKVSSQGVTLTDNTRKVFFRRHFPVNTVIYAGMDPSERRFNNYTVIGFSDSCVSTARMFAFVARKPSSYENSCHVFAELEQEQPASAVVNFINKVMLANRR